MTPKQLAYKTADLMDAKPYLFKYSDSRVPKLGNQGCFIALAGMIAGVSAETTSEKCCPIVYGMEEEDFLDILRMWKDPRWNLTSEEGAKALRAWADSLPDDKSEKPYLELYPINLTANLEEVANAA